MTPVKPDVVQGRQTRARVPSQQVLAEYWTDVVSNVNGHVRLIWVFSAVLASTSCATASLPGAGIGRLRSSCVIHTK